MSCRYFALIFKNEKLNRVEEFFGEYEADCFVERLNSKTNSKDPNSERAELKIIVAQDEKDFLLTYPTAMVRPSVAMFAETKEKAINFALNKHKNQMYGNLPYITHLNHVLEVAKRLGIDPRQSKLNQEILIACLLHDAIEDTDATFKEIETLFSEEVASLVDAVTLPEGMDRKKGYKTVYNKIKATPASAVVKLADRIANLEASLYERTDKLKKYIAEMDDFNEVIFECIEECMDDSVLKKNAISYLNTLSEKIRLSLND